MRLNQIKPNPVRLTAAKDSEIEQLRESILSVGLLTPLIVNREGEIIDGRKRLRALQQVLNSRDTFLYHSNWCSEYSIPVIETRTTIDLSYSLWCHTKNTDWQDMCRVCLHTYNVFAVSMPHAAPAIWYHLTHQATGISVNKIIQYISVGEAIAEKFIAVSPNLTTALQRLEIRKKAHRALDAQLIASTTLIERISL